MRQGFKEVKTAIEDAEQAACPGSCKDVVLITSAMRQWPASVVGLLQNSVTHPRHFLFVPFAITDWLIRRAMLRATDQTAEETSTTGFVGGSQ